MISSASRPYIDASVPVLRDHGVAITRTFYSNMFKAHPELTNLFNMGNQANGSQQQSLAAAVFAYAANIDNPAALGPVINRIVQKHVSVGLTAEHYPIVGHFLLGAIAQTLGDGATPALIAAWTEAYNSLANVFIDAEKKLYAAAEILPGQLRSMRVTQRQQQSTDVVAFTLADAEGQPLPAFQPGQYISVSVELGGGHRQLRQYSLSDAPNGQTYRISVKREPANAPTPAGQVSNWLNDHLEIGSLIGITHPFGEFAPDTESAEPIVLLSAGVGITPMIAVLNRIAKANPQRHMIFAHAARDGAHQAHRHDLAAAIAAMPNLQTELFYETPGESVLVRARHHKGLMSIAALPTWPRTETNVYLCGPVAFMQAQWLALLEAGVPAGRLHREVFGPELLDVLK